MVDCRKYTIILVVLLMQGFVLAQEPSRISDKKSELSHLKKEIDRLEFELRDKAKKEKKSVEMIENYNKQNLYLNKIINSIRAEEKEKDEQIGHTEKEISTSETEIARLKNTYAKYIVYLYKYGRNDELKALLDAGSISQAMVRYKYLQRISSQREKDITELKEKQEELKRLQDNLVKEKDEKHQIGLLKQKEEKSLVAKLNERKTVLKALRNDKEALKKELDLKKKAEGEIRNWIAKLIEEDRRREEARKKEESRRRAEELKAKKNNIAASKKESGKKETGKRESVTSGNDDYYRHETSSKEELETFAARKGSLKWPVDNGRIIRKFGENRNAKLNTVTINYGIDIKTNTEAGVKAVLGGQVSTVNWLPGYGSVLIISHGNNLRTVYGHLGEIYVSEGAKVNSGSVIGKVGESIEGNVLHFEVWNERNNQNPEVWLGRK